MKTLYKLSISFLALIALATCDEEISNHYLTKLGEYKVLLQHQNLTIDSRINMTDIETEVQLSYSAINILGKGCEKHRIECNDTIFELTVNLEEIENRLDNIYSLVGSNRIRPKKIPHPVLDDKWLENLNGHHEKCGEILAGQFTELENNITIGYSRAGEITSAITDMQNNILHSLIFSPTNTVRTMKSHFFNKQFLYKPINLFNYHKIIKFVTFEFEASPKESTIFVKMIIPVFRPSSDKTILYEMHVPFNGQEYGYLVKTADDENGLMYGFKRNLSDCQIVEEPRETIYVCEESIELKLNPNDSDCLNEVLLGNRLDLFCQLGYYYRERFYACLAAGIVMVLSLFAMAAIMIVIRRRNREQKYEYLLKY